MILPNPLIPSEKLEETSDEDAAELVSKLSSQSDAVMEDLNFMMYGDMQEPLTPDGMEIATIHWSKSMRPPLGRRSPRQILTRERRLQETGLQRLQAAA